MRVRKPGVEGKKRHLDSERQKKCHEQPQLNRRRQNQAPRRKRGLNLRIAEGKCSCCIAMNEVQSDDGHQHQYRSDHGIEDKLHRRVNAPLSAPNPNQEVHRDEHHFPKNVKQKEVQRGENADHAAFQQQHEDEVFLQTVIDRRRG